jgi:hypothetical protein
MHDVEAERRRTPDGRSTVSAFAVSRKHHIQLVPDVEDVERNAPELLPN